MLRIVKHRVDGHTGHISVDCHIEERNENLVTKGVVETVGIHPEILQLQYGGDVRSWLQNHHRRMLERHDARKKAAQAMEQLKQLETLEL